jgi:hypothetical protein
MIATEAGSKERSRKRLLAARKVVASLATIEKFLAASEHRLGHDNNDKLTRTHSPRLQSRSAQKSSRQQNGEVRLFLCARQYGEIL